MNSEILNGVVFEGKLRLKIVFCKKIFKIY